MGNHFIQIIDTNDLEQVLERSHEAPVILFKHSSTCPVSSVAYTQMSELKLDVSIVIVQRSRDVSNEIAARTGIVHESPQVLVVRNGKPVWTASHYDITSIAVEDAVRESA